MTGSAPRGRPRAGPVAYAVLVVCTAGSLFPLLWTAVAASGDDGRLARTPPPLWFGGRLPANLRTAWTEANVGRALGNTVLVAGTVAAGTVFFCTLAGFAFAKLRFRGRRTLLAVTVGTMMVPPQLSAVPLFLLLSRLGWTDRLQAVVLPALVSAFGVFFMRQYLLQALPTELLEAARVDGANSRRVVWHVVFPIARPAMVVLGMLTFVQAWNDFFWPVIALTQENPTVQVALTGLGRGYVPDQAVVMAGALLGTLPLLLVFVLCGRRIVGGVMQGALKG
ncbi:MULTISPECIES: carbohydrate ABC transporter permease [Streptomyces]|uniref:Carbohydrate ABC transporter permease n=1 Tax=Streptomyces luteosporeus TaxID=173856 RepID=A0ABP6G3C6_9ACTN